MDPIKTSVFFITAIVLLVAILLSVFVSGETNALFYAVNQYKNKEFNIAKSNQEFCRVYVCGAVKQAGYYTFVLGEETYQDLFSKAGLLSCSIVQNPNLLLSSSTNEIICAFMEDGKVLYPLNVNSDLFILLYQNANIKTDVAQKIEQYRKMVTKIKSIQQLLDDGVLTDSEWQDTFFRIYVGDKL